MVEHPDTQQTIFIQLRLNRVRRTMRFEIGAVDGPKTLLGRFLLGGRSHLEGDRSAGIAISKRGEKLGPAVHSRAVDSKDAVSLLDMSGRRR